MAHKIQVKRGNKADLPTLDAGEFGLCQDTNELFIGNSGNQKIFPPTAPTISDVEGLQTALDGKVDDSQVLTNVPANAKFTDTVTTINGKTGAITKEDITALGIPAQDTVYTHPATHSADMIVDGTTNKAYTATEKNKLAGIKTGANKTTIANNLTETVPGKALDATQGKVLAEQIRDISVEADTIPLSPETAALYGLTGDDAVVDKALTEAFNKFQGNIKTYGNATYADSVTTSGTLTKTIAIGSGKKHGRCVIHNSNNTTYPYAGVVVDFGTDNTKSKVVGNYNNSAGVAVARRFLGSITASGALFGARAVGSDNRLYVVDVYIDGTNLKIVFGNTGTSALSMNCTVDWEVW